MESSCAPMASISSRMMRADALHDPPAQRQHDVDAGGELADEAAAHHQLVADGLGVGRVFFERGHEELLWPASGPPRHER